MLKYSLLFCFFAVSTIRLSAQSDTTMSHLIMGDHIRTDRPTHSESAFLTPRGYFQMEHGFSIEDTDPGFIYSYPNSVWKYGVNENFELRLATHFITIQREPNPDINGFLPLALGVKTKLCDGHGVLPRIALIGELSLPGIVSADFETTYLAPSLRLAFNHEVSSLFNLSYNAGLVWNGETGEPNITYSLTPAFNITKRLGIYGELYGSTPQRDDSDLELRAGAGISYLATNDLLFDVSAGTGVTEGVTSQYVALGISYRFKL